MNNRTYLLALSLFSVSLLLISCQNKNLQNSEEFTPQVIEPDQTNEQLEMEDFNTLSYQLVGGSERDVREPHPVSNSKLQKNHPNIVVLNGSSNENRVALSFDDGPDIRFTPQILDVLAKHDVKATFFLIGARAKAHQEITRRIHDEGHSIGNHTFWHPNLPKESLGRLEWELTETEKVIEDIVGYKPRLFRSPYGALNEEMVSALREKNNTIIGWNVDSLDWKQLGEEVISDNVLSNVDFGSIILMHDGGDWTMDLSGTVKALDKIIAKLKADGVQLVTIPELIGVTDEK